VGGTFLEVRPDGSFLRETGWQDFLVTGGTGGGISPSDPRPAWQVGEGVDNDRSNGNRQCPDVAAAADPDTGYIIFHTDQFDPEQPSKPLQAAWRVVGGTSAAAPLWAGVTALMEQKAAAAGIDGLGFLPPVLYQLRETDPAAFHDTLRGGNLVATSGAGWDYATGIGSPDVAVLSDALIRTLQDGP
jgi:kumamolisin